ncbi:MAG: TonB-dependent receptor [Blastocatellia bacterium]
MKPIREIFSVMFARGRKHLSHCFGFLLGLTLMLSVSSSLSAQTTSTIEGTVKDAQGAPIAGAQIKVSSPALATERTVTTDETGSYRILALTPGAYKLSVTATGFATREVENLELTLNRTVTLDFALATGPVQETLTVNAGAQQLEPSASSTGSTIVPRQIQELPVNGRNYLDLLQLVPGAVVNRQVDPNSDASTPVLGERAGNSNFLIDGLSNKDTVNGGPAAQFNQETIDEFQVLTTGYKAEFGQASGAIVNVITKSGGNQYHGVASLFHRNNAFDSSNSLDETKTEAPFLLRWDYSLALGGPIIKDRAFFFGSAERIRENRRIDFLFPPATPQTVRDFENQFDIEPTQDFQTRTFLKLDQQLGRHHLTQQINYTNGNVRAFQPLAASSSLPSTRNSRGARQLRLVFSDIMQLGDQARPWLVTLRGGYRGEPSSLRPAHPEAGPSTRFNMFNTLTSGQVFGNLGQVDFGNGQTPTNLNQKYTAFDASATKLFGRHDLKFGWNFLRTKVDGIEFNNVFNQLFATLDDFAKFGPVNSGLFTLFTLGGLTPRDNEIHLRNNYNGLFVQDDWKLLSKLTLNLGLRWDYDSAFPNKENFSPRLGAAWSVTSKTVVRGQFGVFYDQFRLGLARDIPPFGGADLRSVQPISYPRLFFGIPTTVPQLVGLCLSPTMTDEQIAASGATCRNPALPLIGVDRLSRVVAPGRAPIPFDAVVNISNVQALSGLSPQEFADRASQAIGRPAGFFFWGPFGALTQAFVPANPVPITIDPSFRTPHTLSFSLGVQQQITKDLVVEADYYHRDIRNLLGVRQTNIAFESRLPGRSRTFLPPRTNGPISGFGPWFEGTYDGLTLSFNKRFSNRFVLAGYYGYARAKDNNPFGILTIPSDSFVGIVPEVTEASTGKTNKDGSFTAANNNFIPKAGTFHNGPDFDNGPSALALDHTFLINGLVELPWQIQISSIFRAQSGFHFSRLAAVAEDPDGNLTFNGIDHGPGGGRNRFTAPRFLNADMRFAKRFKFGESVTAQVLFEFFNLFNTQNPAAVEAGVGRPIPFGKPTQVLPGREGQIGVRIAF